MYSKIISNSKVVKIENDNQLFVFIFLVFFVISFFMVMVSVPEKPYVHGSVSCVGYIKV